MKYNKDTINKIVKAIEGLKGRVGASKEAGINFDTFCDWMKKKAEFSDIIKRAEERANQTGKEIAIQSIFKAMLNGQWTAGAWWLERKYSSEYAIKQKIEHSGAVANIDLSGLKIEDLLKLANLSIDNGHNETNG